MKQGIFVLVLLVLVISGCSDKDTEPIGPENLSGKWVELDRPTDTLHFVAPIGGLNLFHLKRAELFRSGPYEYQLLSANSVSIRWMLAATLTYQEYPFKVSGNILTVGNFYDSPSGDILKFRKVE